MWTDDERVMARMGLNLVEAWWRWSDCAPPQSQGGDDFRGAGVGTSVAGRVRRLAPAVLVLGRLATECARGVCPVRAVLSWWTKDR